MYCRPGYRNNYYKWRLLHLTSMSFKHLAFVGFLPYIFLFKLVYNDQHPPIISVFTACVASLLIIIMQCFSGIDTLGQIDSFPLNIWGHSEQVMISRSIWNLIMKNVVIHGSFKELTIIPGPRIEIKAYILMKDQEGTLSTVTKAERKWEYWQHF